MAPDDAPDGIGASPAGSAASADDAMLRLHAETLDVRRSVRTTGIVRASSVTTVQDHVVDEQLASERVSVLRVPVDRMVDACPPIRVEGDTTILSIVEEVLVVERRLVLKEEVHLTKIREVNVHRQTVALRQQHAVITREPQADMTPLAAANSGAADQHKKDRPNG